MDSIRDSVRTTHELLEQKAAELGDAPFVECEEDSVTYKEFNAEVNLIANGLIDANVTTTDNVALYMYSRIEYLYSLFAIGKIGATAVPIDTRFSEDSLEHILSETQPEAVILDNETRASYEAVEKSASGIGQEYMVDGQSSEQSYPDFSQLKTGNQSAVPDTEIDGSDPCMVFFINRYGGSVPDGIVLPHYSFVNTGAEIANRHLEFSEQDCIYTTLPFYAPICINAGLFGAMFANAKFAFNERFAPKTFWNRIRKYDASEFLYLGRMLSVLVNQTEKDRVENPLKCAFGVSFGFSREEETIRMFEDIFDVTVLEGYGAEPIAASAAYNLPDSRKIGSVGKPNPYSKVMIVDENGWEVQTGEIGEIVVRSTRPNTMLKEIYNDPEKTATVCRNQWIHTNDLGYLDEDGFLYFVGNKSNTIHLGRVAGPISSLEIESVIENYSGVKNSQAFGVETPRGEEDIKIVVIPEEDSEIKPSEIIKHCRQELTYYKIPRYVEIRERLPRTPEGKIRKEELMQTGLSAGVWDRKARFE